MKKKLALLMAGIMSLSSISLFAATDNVIESQKSTIQKKTLYMEDTWTVQNTTGGFGQVLDLSNIKPSAADTDDLKFVISGSTFYAEPKKDSVSDNFKEGDQIQFRLTNAEWFYRNDSSAAVMPATPTRFPAGSAGNASAQIAKYAKDFIDYTGVGSDFVAGKSVTDTDRIAGKVIDAIGANTSTSLTGYEKSTFDKNNGILIKGDGSVTGYLRYKTAGEISYIVRFNKQDRSMATLTVLEAGPKDALRLPIVVRATGEGEALLNASNSSTNRITGGEYKIGAITGSGTTTTVQELVEARYGLELKNFVIKEKAIGSLHSGSFVLEAPYGYSWGDPAKSFKDNDDKNKFIEVSTTGGLFIKDGTEVRSSVSRETKSNMVNYYTDTTGSGSSLTTRTYTNKLVFNFSDAAGFLGLINSIDSSGSLIISNLRLIAEDNASFDSDIIVQIYDTDDKGAGVSDEDVKVGVRKDWAVVLEVDEKKVPTLFNGRFEFKDANSNGKFDFQKNSEIEKNHRSADVKFREVVAASWWSTRQTDLTLPEGVKFVQVKIKDAENFNETKVVDFESTYVHSDKRVNHVEVKGNKVILTDLWVKEKDKAEFVMESWLSAESGFEGDAVLTATGSGIDPNRKVPSVVIAKFINPIKLETVVTDVVIGLQNQKVADITMTETAAGALLEERDVTLQLYDGISPDAIYFDSTVVTEKSGNIEFTKPVTKAGTVSFRVSRESNKDAAAIKFTNVYVKLDRTVPESNARPYRVYAGGSSIAANYRETYSGFEPYFSTRGISADFLNVVTSHVGANTSLATHVAFTIGDTSAWVGRNNPTEVVMDTAPYISSDSNSTMVPVRFVAESLGVQVIWNEATREVTLDAGNRVVTFKLLDNKMRINGNETIMYSVDGKVVYSEVKDDRAFLPLRQIANALQVTVEWDAETQTAIFNPDNKNVVPVEAK